ncbi:hypothetical protein V5799_016714 [Amblyomma americanum]|uniref:Uncharacterized protein n=1 Tax=Amblyomma americanum TaxID=6943 RepID=A0AAQ4F5E6_AMBAM
MRLCSALGRCVIDDRYAHSLLLLQVTMGMLTIIFVVCGAWFGVKVARSALRKLGFHKSGVKPGTIASKWQSSFHGAVQRHSVFATLQAWAMKDFPLQLRIIFTLIGMQAGYNAAWWLGT